MLRYPKPSTTTSTEMIDRTEKFFVKQIPILHLRKYSLTPLQHEVLNELHYQCYMRATEKNPLETSFKELSVYLDRAEHSVTDAIKRLAELKIISLTVTKGKGMTGIKIYFLVNLLEESDSYLSPIVKALEKKFSSTEGIQETPQKKVKEDNSEPEIKETPPSPPPKEQTLEEKFPGFSGF